MDKVVAADYYGIKRVTTIESFGSFIVWDEKIANRLDHNYKSTLKLLNRETGEIRAFTSGSKMDYNPKFSPDGRSLAFISTRNEKPQIFIMPIDGGEAHCLTKTRNGVSSFEWSPNGQNIAYTTMTDPNEGEEEEKPETKFELERLNAEKDEKNRKLNDPKVITKLVYRQGTSYDHPDRFSHIYIIDVKSKESRRISDGYYHHSKPVFIDDNSVIATSKRELPIDLSTKSSLLKFNIDDTSEGELICEYSSNFPTPPVATSIDSCYLNVWGDGTPAGATTKWAALKGNETEIINLELDRTVLNLKLIGQNTVYLLVEDSGKNDLRVYDPDNRSFTKVFDTDLSIIDYTVLSQDEIYFTATSPTQIWAVWEWTKTDGVKLVEDPNADGLSSKTLVEPEEMWFTNAEGIKFQGWFFDASKIEGNPEKPGMVLSIHGGPHVMWTNAGTMMHEWQTTVSAGYSVLALNPIGSQGYGQDFSQLIVPNKWGLDDSRDLLQAVDEVSARVNTDRLYITGGSYAGFQTANVITKDHRFKAAVAQRGVYDFTSFGYLTDIPVWFSYEMGGFPHDSDEKLVELWRNSPLANAREIQTPLLIIHAENDFRVPIAEGEALFAALKLEDKEAVFVRYPRDGHELSRSGEPDHVVDRLERMLDWFNTHQ